MNWLDIVVIAIILISAIIGLCKGFFDGIISICSIFVSALISVKTANWFAGVIRSVLDIDGWFDTILKDKLGVGDSLIIFGASYPREKLAAFLTVLLSGILMFIFIRCIVRLLSNLFKSITSKSVALGGLNRFFGFLLGAVKGSLVVAVALSICSILVTLGIPGLSDTISTTINNTSVTSFAYGYVDKYVEGKMNGKSFDEIINGVFDEDKANEQDNNTILEVAYPDGSTALHYTLGQTVDYNDITFIYKPGKDAETHILHLTASNFSEAIDTSAVTERKEVTVTAYGKTCKLYYTVTAE